MNQIFIMTHSKLSLFDSHEFTVEAIEEQKPELLKVAEVELIYKSKVKTADRPKITRSSDSFKILQMLFADLMEHREAFWILLLNRANKAIGAYCVSLGGVAGTVADPKLIFQAALKANACGIILAHNHPSGNLQPSEADLKLTTKLRDAGKFLEIQVLDHIIMTEGKYYSFADEGMM
jgi:DNA repair protein RadC